MTLKPNRTCNCGNKKSAVSDECTVCYIERLITYTRSKQSIVSAMKYALLEEERSIFDDLNTELFETSCDSR